MRELIIQSEDAGSRLDRYLKRFLIRAPQGFVYKMLRKKNIVRNGRRAEGGEILSAGDVITLYLSDETIASFTSTAAEHVSDKKIRILYEDADILAADKPAGLLVQRDKTGQDALTDLVTGYLMRSGAVTDESLLHFRPSPAGRLDRNTSGVVLFGKTLSGQQKLAEAMRDRTLTKRYLALVAGRPEECAMDRAYLVKDAATNRVTVYESPRPGAEEIRTGIRVLESRGGYALTELMLYTGKPHQLRARLAGLGHPIAGDRKYGKQKDGFRQMHLHCFSVTADTEELRFRAVSPLPAHFRNSLARLGFSPVKTES